MKDENWKELKRLHDQGWALHWLHPRSKRPIESKWTSGERKTWESFRKSYKPRFNVGVRLGGASKLENGTYLGVIDCDVKSTDRKHLASMEKKLASLLSTTPSLICLSGRGNGSRHIYVRSTKPLSPARYSQSPDMVSCLMGTVKPSRRDLSALSETDIKAGLRQRPAWEISVMGEGQQVVLPPSIHPDSGKSYRWVMSSRNTSTGLSKSESIPLFQAPTSLSSSDSEVPTMQNARAPIVAHQAFFIPCEVDLLFDPREVPENLANLILNGDGCSDRSASLYTVAKQLARLKFTENEILSVLSDPTTFLGRCAYDHTGSPSRSRAVKWLSRYTTAKGTSEVIREEQETLGAFSSISEDEAASQLKEVFGASSSIETSDWRMKISRTGKNGDGPPKPDLNNIVLILTNAIGPDLFKRDQFRCRDVYSREAPWGGKADKAVDDTDVNLIRHWLGTRWRFEPRRDLVDDAIDIMAQWNAFHPIREYLGGLPEWDGVERLNTWLHDKLGARGPKEFLAQAFRKWMVAAVKRVFEPGAQFDWMLVLEGVEGLGKSTFFRNLAGPQFFRDNLPDLRDKDSAQALDGIWIVELAEVEDYFRRNQREVFKAYLTRRVDKYRPAFGRRTIEVSRQCVFAGSTNEERFLHSESGNRRVVPVKVGDGGFDFTATLLNRDQLWAEAYLIYRMGLEETLELEGEAKEIAQGLQTEDKRVQTDADLMVEALLEWRQRVEEQPNSAVDFGRISLMSLFEPTGPFGGAGGTAMWRYQIASAMQAGKALVKVGAVKREISGRNYWSWRQVSIAKVTRYRPEEFKEMRGE